MHPESSNTFEFLLVELSCVAMNMEAISNTSCKKVNILFIAVLSAFFYYTQLVKVGRHAQRRSGTYKRPLALSRE
jgi:hypothetical protein